MQRIYFNLHSHVFSIQEKRRDARGHLVWRVVDYAEKLLVKNVRFRVYESGRKRVISSGQKNVHAFVEGDIVPDALPVYAGKAYRVRYNPFEGADFTHNGEPIKQAPALGLTVVGGKPQMHLY